MRVVQVPAGWLHLVVHKITYARIMVTSIVCLEVLECGKQNGI